MGGILGGILGAIGGNRGGKNLATGFQNAEQGVLGATGAAQNDISQALWNYYGVPNIAAQAPNYLPYQGAGNVGLSGLENYNPTDYFNSPAYNFQLQKGQNAITNQASAMGLGASGNTLRSLEDYGQGLAATYQNQAFNQAMQRFGGLIGAGQYGVSGASDLARYLAGFQLTGQEALGNAGFRGAESAGNYAAGVGAAQGGANANFYNQLASAATGVSGLFGTIGGLFGPHG